MFKRELLLLGFLYIVAISAQYQIQVLSPGDLSCTFDYNSEYSVLHCPDYAYVQAKGNKEIEIPFQKKANRFLTFLSPEGPLFLFRDNEIIHLQDIFNDNQQKYQNSFPIEEKKIDFRAAILIKDGLLFYKHYDQCTVSLIPLDEGLFSVFRNKFDRLSSVVLDYSQQLGDCRLNFTAVVAENILHVFIFIQDTHYLANITIQNQKVVQISSEHIIQPDLFLEPFDWFRLKAHQNFIVLLTSNHKSKSCAYVLYNGKFNIHKEYAKCRYYEHFEFIFAENQDMFLTTIDSSSVSISYLRKNYEGASIEEQTFSKYLTQTYPKYLFVLTSQSSPVLMPKTGIKLVHAYSFANPDGHYIIDNYPMIFNLTAPPTCDKIRANILSTEFECLLNHIPDDVCRNDCKLKYPTDSCLNCIREYISKVSGQDCINLNKMGICTSEGYLPTIFPHSSCNFKISRIENSLSLRITNSEIQNFCIFVLDFGNSRKEFLIRRNPERYSYTNSLIIHDEKHTQHIKMQANQILFRGEGHSIKLVMQRPSDSEIKFESYDAFHRSFHSTEMCIICNTMGSIPDLSLNALYLDSSKRVGHWKFSNDESYCESNSKISQGYVVNEWYECMAESEEEQGGICTTDPKDSTKIVLDRGFRVPFCKVKMTLNPDQSLILAIDLQAYEDLVIGFKGKFLPYRDHHNQGKMLIAYAKSEALSDTPEEVDLYFVSQKPEETLKRKEFVKIEKKHSISIDRYLSLATTVVILLFIFLLLCTFVKRIADDYKRKLSIQTIKCPYEAAKFKRGNPKELLLDELQLEALKKTGIEFTTQGVPVEIEGRDCEVCLHPLKEKDYRIYLCGIHFTHVDCFRRWFKKRPKGQANILCPNKCTKILIPPHLSVILEGISVEITQDETVYTEDMSNSSTSTRKNSDEENNNTAPSSARNSGKKVAPENPSIEEEGEAPGDIIILPMKKPHTLTHNLQKRPPQLGVFGMSSESTETGSPTKKLNGSSEEGSPNVTHEGRQREMANMLADVLMELGEDEDMSVVGFSRNTSEGLPLIK